MPARMAGCRGNQPIDQAGGLDVITPAERLDDALHVPAALARVLDKVKVLVGSNLLDADKHGRHPADRSRTTILCANASKILTTNQIFPPV
jgi:hypothetical protein